MAKRLSRFERFLLLRSARGTFDESPKLPWAIAEALRDLVVNQCAHTYDNWQRLPHLTFHFTLLTIEPPLEVQLVDLDELRDHLATMQGIAAASVRELSAEEMARCAGTRAQAFQQQTHGDGTFEFVSIPHRPVLGREQAVQFARAMLGDVVAPRNRDVGDQQRVYFGSYWWDLSRDEQFLDDCDLELLLRQRLEREARQLARRRDNLAPVISPEQEGLAVTTPMGIRTALDAIDPRDFEHLIAKLLSNLGATDVETTCLSGDGGIDIRAIVSWAGLIRGPMVVQVKRWANNVQAPYIQQFRGTLSEKEVGLFVTTSDFSCGAYEEANRPGKKQVHLVNGEKLARALLQLGIDL